MLDKGEHQRKWKDEEWRPKARGLREVDVLAAEFGTEMGSRGFLGTGGKPTEPKVSAVKVGEYYQNIHQHFC